MRFPCSSSFSTPASQVFCTAKTPQTPVSARSSDAASSRSPATTSAPSAAAAFAGSLSGLRVIARSLNPPCFARWRSVAPPCLPVAPVIRTTLSFAIWILLDRSNRLLDAAQS